jgi:DNA-binding CsgD family transcriptional regulator
MPRRPNGRELAALIILSNGGGLDKVAEILLVSPESAQRVIDSAVRALGANNHIHAVAEAKRRGLIG